MPAKAAGATGLWKIRVNAELTLEQVTEGLRSAHTDLAEAGKLTGGGLLDRVDVADGETVIYLSGEEGVARGMAKTLKGLRPRTRADVDKATTKAVDARR